MAKIAEAKQTLQHQGKPIQPGRLIAELSFGFWTSLFDRRYEPLLWPRLLKPVFPIMPRRIRTTRIASRRLNGLRTLRNRVFHYEPIWRMPNLHGLHQDIVETIGWMNPSMHDAQLMLDHFPEIYSLGLTPYQQIMTRLLTHPGGP